MDEFTVASSNIATLAHDRKTKEMRVRFNNGKVYVYDNVDDQEFQDFLDAPSTGRHFATVIRPNLGGGRPLEVI
jgi:hypothetical protein